MTPIPRLAETILQLLVDGMFEDLSWTCEVFDIDSGTRTKLLRSEFVTYCPYGGRVLRLRAQCDRRPPGQTGLRGVECCLRVEELSAESPSIDVSDGTNAARLFGLLHQRHARELQLEAREPFRPEPPAAGRSFDEILAHVGGQSPALWRWSVVDHTGHNRELEHRYETRIDRLQFTLQEFTDAATGKVRCVAQMEWAVAESAPLPVLDPHQAALLVAAVKERALAARDVRG
jgi:hypothetical protein